MKSLYGISTAKIEQIIKTEIEDDINEPFVAYSAIGKGHQRHRFSLKFSTNQFGKYTHLEMEMLEATLKYSGHTIRRLIVEEDQINHKLGFADYRATDLITQYCTALHEMHLMNFLEIGDDINQAMGKLRRMAITNSTLSLPLGDYFTKCENTLIQLEITKTAVDMSTVKLPKLRHLKLSNSIVMDFAKLLENCSSLEVLEILDCHLIGISSAKPEHVKKIHMLNLKSNDNFTLGQIKHFPGLKTLRIETDLIADTFLQDAIERKNSLESITFDAFVTIRTLNLIVKDKFLRHLRIEGRCLTEHFTDNHFAVLGENTLHELELRDFKPLMDDLIYVIQTSPELKALYLNKDQQFAECHLIKLREAAGALEEKGRQYM